MVLASGFYSRQVKASSDSYSGRTALAYVTEKMHRKLSEKRIFPAIDIPKSGTRREDLLLTKEEQEAVDIMRRALNGMKSDEAVDSILNMFDRTKNNVEFVQIVKKTKFI